MPRFLKSDLTYSLSGGFALGIIAFFLMQPMAQQDAVKQNIAMTAKSITKQPG